LNSTSVVNAARASEYLLRLFIKKGANVLPFCDSKGGNINTTSGLLISIRINRIVITD